MSDVVRILERGPEAVTAFVRDWIERFDGLPDEARAAAGL